MENVAFSSVSENVGIQVETIQLYSFWHTL